MEFMNLMDGIQRVDAVCQKVYESGAASCNMNLGTGEQIIATTQWMLANTTNGYTQLFALVHLRRALMVHWFALSEDKIAALHEFLEAILERVAGNAKITHDVAALLALMIQKRNIVKGNNLLTGI